MNGAFETKEDEANEFLPGDADGHLVPSTHFLAIRNRLSTPGCGYLNRAIGL